MHGQERASVCSLRMNMSKIRSRGFRLSVLSVVAVCAYFAFINQENYASKNIFKSNLQPSREIPAQEVINRSKEININSKPKTILLWNKLHHKKAHTFLVFNRIIHKRCPESNCNVIMDQNRLMEADAVWFDMLARPTLPTIRRENQVWVAYHHESTMYLMRPSEPYKDAMNWTMSYKWSSDIYLPYGGIHKLPIGNVNLPDMTANKTGTVLWFVSHCPTESKREQYVRELRKYIEVDVYGKCGDKKCGAQRGMSHQHQLHSCDTLTDSYYFYLAFENTICEDLASEKLFYALSAQTIPVVLGGANYSKFVPPHSIINVFDFESPKLLADYLKKLISDPALYNSYFTWKRNLKAEVYHPESMQVCELCSKLHGKPHLFTSNVGEGVYHKAKSEKSWMYPQECIFPNQINYNEKFSQLRKLIPPKNLN